MTASIKELAAILGVQYDIVAKKLRSDPDAPHSTGTRTQRGGTTRTYDVADVEQWWRSSGHLKQPDTVSGTKHGTEHAYREHRCRCRRCRSWRASDGARSRTGKPRAAAALDRLIESLLDPTLNDSEIDALAAKLAAISSPTRLHFLGILQESDGPVQQSVIANRLCMDDNTVAYHATRLMEVGIVERSKGVRRVTYRMVA